MGKKLEEMVRRINESERRRLRSVSLARQAGIFIRSILPSLSEGDRRAGHNIATNIKQEELNGWTFRQN